MDLTNLEPTRDAVWVDVIHPVTREPIVDERTGARSRVQIFGIDSEPFRERQRVLKNRTAEAQRKGVKSIATLLDGEDTKTVAACIAGLENIELDGAPVTYSPASVLELLRRLPWLQRQLDTEMADMANFIRASSTS